MPISLNTSANSNSFTGTASLPHHAGNVRPAWVTHRNVDMLDLTARRPVRTSAERKQTIEQNRAALRGLEKGPAVHSIESALDDRLGNMGVFGFNWLAKFLYEDTRAVPVTGDILIGRNGLYGLSEGANFYMFTGIPEDVLARPNLVAEVKQGLARIQGQIDRGDALDIRKNIDDPTRP